MMNKLKKRALRMIAEHLTVDKVAGIKERFQLMDIGNKGKIYINELRLGLQKLGHQIPESDVQILMDVKFLNGEVDVPLSTAFEETYRKKKPGGTREEWVEPRAKNAYEEFKKSIEDWTRIWTTMVGGPKKGKTYGLRVNQYSSLSSPMLPNSVSIFQNAEEWK
ncbi:hypothetical protein P3S68_003668 [Capsicum galapagoense]